MPAPPATPTPYTDFASLTRLKGEARARSPEAIRKVAEQFEALFVQMMLKSMREASPTEDPFAGSSMGTYQDLYDHQLSLLLARGEGIGLKKMLVAQLSKQPSGGPGAAPLPPAASAGAQTNTAAKAGRASADGDPPPPYSLRRTDASLVTGANGSGSRPGPAPGRSPGVAEAKEGLERPVEGSARTHASATVADPPFASPTDFARRLWGPASRAAADLGLPPEALIAQAALETGWGARLPGKADGGNSHNLFGIKAHGWSGDTAVSPTLEFEGGALVRRNEAFRAYDSYEAGFRDYVDFLRANPRYEQALRNRDPAAFLQGLAKAGYATDPAYARKLTNVLRGETLQTAMADLKSSANLPLTG